MSTPTPGKAWVESAPPVEPYAYGLFSVATFEEASGAAWQAHGVEYFSNACAQGGIVIGSCPVPLLTPGTATVTATPDASADTVDLAADADNTFAVTYSLVPTGAGAPVSGQINPGQTLSDVAAPAGTYTLRVSRTGAPPAEDGPLTVPGGTPVTVTLTVQANDAAAHRKPVTQGLELVQGSEPFTVYARAECNAVGFEDPQQLALDRLELLEQREAERYMSQYVLGAPAPRQPAGTTPLPLKRALGLLERDAALFYAGTPTLHAPRWTAPYFADRAQLQANADTRPVLRTILNSRVAFGGGYYDNPFDPDEPPTDGFWLVATGSVRVMRAQPFVNETFTPATNLRMALAERTYAVDADCYRAAVLVTTAGED